MQKYSNNSLFGSMLLMGAASTLAGQVLRAETFTTLHSFNGTDGSSPLSGLVLSGDTLFGTTVSGGRSNLGTVFKINNDGTAFTTLHHFSGGADGGNPKAGLVLSGSTLYGTAAYGGSAWGTVFKINTDGTAFTTVYTFSAGTDGSYPYAGLTLDGNVLYGAAGNTVFTLNEDGSGFTTLYDFRERILFAGLLLSNSRLYGATISGGDWSQGSLFTVDTGGTSFSTLYSFTNGADGSGPYAELISSGNTLYGTAIGDGVNSLGTVFAVSTDGTDFRTLHAFTGPNDGARSGAPLTLSGNTLYGTAQ